jgi:transcriptional regulator with XRE-family HTH domain
MVYLVWHDEEYQGPDGQVRTARVAWLAQDVPDADGVRRQYLAYLGRRPMVTADLIWEMRELYPDLYVDWDAIRQELWRTVAVTDVRTLSDDELATRLRALARERGLSLLDLGARISSTRNVVAELEHLLRETATIARIERTSGSIYRYLREKHPEYAYCLLKVRLFLEGRWAELEAVKAAEPAGLEAGLNAAGYPVQRRFYERVLERYETGAPLTD